MADNNAFVTSYESLFEYADELKWAAEDMHDCYHNMKRHAEDCSQRWKDSSAEIFMQTLENKEHVIQELVNEFNRYEEAVRKRADMVREYVSIGKKYRL